MPPNSPLQDGNTQMHNARSGSGESEQAVRQRRSREDMNAARQELSERARTATDKRRKRDEKQQDLERLEQSNAQFGEVNSSSLLGYFIAALAPLAVWLIDVTLLNQAASYLLGPGDDLGWVIADYGVYLIPTAIILMEMLLSRQRLAAKREANRFGDLSRGTDATHYRVLKVFSAIMACAIPVMAVSAILAKELAGTGIAGMSAKKWGPIAGTALLAFVAHGIMVYAGTWIHNARGYLFYRLRRWRRRSSARRAESAYEDACNQVADQFDTYQEAHSLCDRLHPSEEIQLGPFSMHVRTALNDHYGFEYMAVPDGLDNDGAPNTPPSPEPDSSGAPVGDGPTPTPPTGGTDAPSGDGAMPSEPSSGSPPSAEPAPPSDDASTGGDDGDSQAMADYYRSVAEAQRRDADGEISL